jgi:hypothetical protein
LPLTKIDPGVLRGTDPVRANRGRGVSLSKEELTEVASKEKTLPHVDTEASLA